MDKTAIKNYAQEARRKLIETVKHKATTLNKEVSSQEIENIACTWFNRLIALRIMEVNEWLPSNIRILSSREKGRLEPETIREIARLDYIDHDIVAEILQKTDMNAVDRLYRYVLIEQCKKLSSILPGIFKGADNDTSYTLLPDSLISKDGIVYDFITKVDESNFDLSKQGQIEIIGWLYQFYISEKKDEVFAGLKKNVKINKETIPAATQLFTPEWIVKYMVENSLGRLWLERKPNDTLKANWKYYLEEAEQEPEVAERLRAMRQASPIKSPEDIKFIDPCMGSGHILVYAFDVLYQIYESEGYAERDIPNLILEKNLHGLDIDDRACQLAYFALMMKARSKNRRFFRPRGDEVVLQPMVYSAKGDSELEEFGSLIKVENLGDMPNDVLDFNDENYMEASIRLNGWHFRKLLSQKYDVVVTNPPYMGSKGQNNNIVTFLKENYPNTKTDTFSAFIERCSDLLLSNGYTGMFTPYVWMFTQSYDKLRKHIYAEMTITSLIQHEYSAFEEATVSVCSFVLSKRDMKEKGTYLRLVDFRGGMEVQRQRFLDVVQKTDRNYLFYASSNNFNIIPGSPITYWVKNFSMFDFPTLKSKFVSGGRNKTHNNDKYVRTWWEIVNRIKWIPYANGGYFRKWYGNHIDLVDWSIEAKYFYSQHGGLCNEKFWDKEGITWGAITSGQTAFRIKEAPFIYSSASPTIFNAQFLCELSVLGYLNTKVCSYLMNLLNPTVNQNPNDTLALPFNDEGNDDKIAEFVTSCIDVSRMDWDNFETSWDFQRHPLLKVGKDTWWNESDIKNHRIEDSFNFWRYHTDSQFAKLKANEEELNRIFIDIYGLQDELTPELEDKDVTICKADLGRDIRSFISYAIGCMFGRYSLDEPGLIFAGGNFDPTRYVTFTPVTDNLIPIGVKDYFDSDIVVRFMEFVKIVYGEESFGENLAFIAESIYPNASGTTNEKLRRYFLTDFYKDHLKTYQKRPIYWLLDSGKKNGFKALIYLHRYNRDTIGIARTDYLHKQRQRYEGEVDSLQDRISQTRDSKERAVLQKEANAIQAAFDECRNYDQIMAHIAHQRIELNLDDGVKVNYAKFQEVEVPKDDGGIEKMDLLGRI